jgi:hypothetical protein
VQVGEVVEVCSEAAEVADPSPSPSAKDLG